MDTTKSGKSFWDFLTRNSKKFIIGLMVLAGITLVSAGALWWSYTKPIATVNGEKITRADYNRAKEIANKTADYLGNNSVATSEKVTNDLVEQKIMDVIAKDKGLAVTDAEIADRFNSNTEKYDKSVAKLVLTYKTAYGYEEDELKKAVYYDILKTKLSEQMLSSRDGRYVYTRFNAGNGVEDITGLAVGQLDAWAKAEIDKIKTQLDAGTSFDIVYKAAQNDPKYSYPAKYGSEFADLNGSSEGYMSTEKNAILALSKGENSPVIKNETYYAIYHLDKVSAGTYDSWDEMMVAYKTKYLSRGVFGLIYSNAPAKLFTKIANKLGVKTALAGSCSTCSSCVGANIHGRIWNAITGANIPDASVTATGSRTFCEGNTALTAYCGNKRRSLASDTATSGDNYNFGVSNGSTCFANCGGGPFLVTTARSGYFNNQSGYFLPTNGAPIIVDVSMMPSPIPTVNKDLDVTKVSVNGGDGTITGMAEQTNWSQPVISYYSSGRHFITINPAENPPGVEGITFYAYTSPAPDSVPIYRFFKTGHYYSQSNVIPAGYTYEGVAFYAYVTPVSGRTAVHQYYKGTTDDHFYSTAATPAGYQDNGVAFYVPGNTSYDTDETTVINCGPECTTQDATFAYGNGITSTTVTLTAAIEGTSRFDGWSGACTGDGTCVVEMTETRNVVATFSYTSTPPPPPPVLPKSLTCDVNPDTGLAPLVVKVKATPTNLTSSAFTYYMGDIPETVLSNKPATLYFTYSSAGSYMIYVSNSDYNNNQKVQCSTSPVSVKNSTDNTGGEVSP